MDAAPVPAANLQETGNNRVRDDMIHEEAQKAVIQVHTKGVPCVDCAKLDWDCDVFLVLMTGVWAGLHCVHG